MLLGRQQKGSLQKGKLNLLIKCRKIFDLWGILPYDYSKKEKSFFVKPNKKIRQLRWKLWLSLWFTLVSFLQTVYLWSTLSLPQLLQCWFYIFFTACGCYTIYDQVNNCHEIVALLNGMVAFEKAHPQDDTTSIETIRIRKRICIFIIKMLTFAGTFIPIIGQLSFIRKPCVVIQPGFFLISKCNSDSIHSPFLPPTSPLNGHLLPFLPTKLIMLIIGLITLSCRAFVLNSFLSQMCIGVIMKPYCLHSYLLFISQKSDDFFEGCALYKEYQFLIQFFNMVYRRSVACVLFFVVCEGTLSLYACISLGAFLPPERRIIFGYTAFNSGFLCINVIYGMLAAISDNSVEFLEEFKNKHEKQLRGRFNRKMFRLCVPVRIALGDGFVETCTPLESQNVIIDQTVNLILVE